MPFTVEEFRDLVRILEEKPEWRAELRRLVLTEELLSLPEQIAALRAETERRFQEMAATVDKLAREVARLGIGMGDLVKTQKRLIIDVADLKGERLERRYRERAPAYFGGLIRRARALTTEDLDELLEPAVDRGHLSEDDAKEVLHSDVVVRGRRREDGGRGRQADYGRCVPSRTRDARPAGYRWDGETSRMRGRRGDCGTSAA